MRMITWNVHGAKRESGVWKLLLELQPDLILLQEVGNDLYSRLRRCTVGDQSIYLANH